MVFLFILWFRSLGVMPREEMDVGEEMFDDKVHKPINNKKRCGIFLGLLSLSLLLIVPIVSVTLYQFVTCFEMNHKLSLGITNIEKKTRRSILVSSCVTSNASLL